MPVACADFLAFADSVDSQGNEISLRASVSRAYYGTYHACKDWHAKLPAPGYDTGVNGGLHQTLINQLTHPESSCSAALSLRSRSIGYVLQELKLARTISDYHLDQTVTKEVMENVRERAKVLVEQTQLPLPTGPNPQAPRSLKRIT